MATNKPEVLGYLIRVSGQNILVDHTNNPDGLEKLIRLSEYEALQAECEKLRNLLVEIERGCSRRDMPSEQTISSWADAIDAAIQGDKP